MSELPTVLLVDDDEAARFLSTRLLRRLGLQEQVRQAGNGREALDLLTTDCRAGHLGPTLVLLDLNMPVMGGFEFLKASEELPPPCRALLRVVVLSSTEQAQEMQLAGQLSAEFISKPLTQEVLARLLRDHAGYAATA